MQLGPAAESSEVLVRIPRQWGGGLFVMLQQKFSPKTWGPLCYEFCSVQSGANTQNSSLDKGIIMKWTFDFQIPVLVVHLIAQTEYLTKGSLRVKRFILAHSLRVHSIPVRKLSGTGRGLKQLVTLHLPAEQKGMLVFGLFSHFIHSRTLAHGMMTPPVKVDLLTLVNLVQIIPHRSAQRLTYCR